MQAEVYTRGMFEPYELNTSPVFNLNLIYDREADSERFDNALPERFQDETDLQDYMSGILDVVYTLDYAEAEAVFGKTPEEKQKWFHKLEQIEDTKTRSNQGAAGSKHNLDSVRELTLDEAKELNTIDDLIRDSIIVSRYEVNGMQTTGTMASNGYYVVPLFSANYAGVQNDSGVSGDAMIRRQAFELLAEYGYYDGMVPYLSNQYKTAATEEQTILSDTYILNKIFAGTYGTMADFKKAMFQKRIEKVDELKPITILWEGESVPINHFETLQRLMNEAVASDLDNVYVTSSGYNNIRAQDTQVERLKAQIFKAYLFQTRDFQESIYGDGQEPIVPTATPAVSPVPTAAPTLTPTATPSGLPTSVPTVTPTIAPTVKPSENPTGLPFASPTVSAEPPVSSGTPSDTGFVLPEEEEFLFARVSSAKTSQTVRWRSVKSADGYYIYGAKSGAGYKRLGIVGKKTLRWKRTGLKKGTKYQYYVAAYRRINGKRVVISKSLPVYSTTKGGKYGNPVRIRVEKLSVNVKSAKKIRLKVKVGGKSLRKDSRKIRYVSTDSSIARVSKKGIVTGMRRGICYIYCVTSNGLFRRVKVSVVELR